MSFFESLRLAIALGLTADTIHVTLALPAEDAARVIYAKEYGRVWLTLEPEGADDEDTRTIVVE